MEFHLLLCIVKDDDIVEDILTGFLELGIGGATVLSAKGMAEIISAQIPLFAGFKDVFQAGGSSRIILAAVHVNMIDKARELIRHQIQPDSGPPSGISFSLPILTEIGLSRQVFEDEE